ncbi:hypothetical protein BN946_scf184766.g34 [Trametes cinnabarina]|uniref:Uncharacterized protein n=1 Tax=Pycnoporus cinnabarinus TaxID=5643 RepID=A0A060SC16_PYCCI|nr:hypothetical protein BN946_scf184766.g34 [Trametes cinnabarina]
MSTRPGLKSCLKITPPITPDFSAASSPCGSGRTSPSLASDGGSSTASGGRKSVSFCPANELEEVFFADEWDRTPAAVTPKLSYQDILELKQLRISLPYSPPPPTSRQPFTTSLPASSPSSSSSSSSKPPFPVSRFAVGPSLTPSKWKNRAEPKVDPEILPYLDAVPIRLLPLLPQSPPSETPLTDAPEPHPQTPTPTASPERKPAPPPPSEPPEITIAPHAPVPALAPNTLPEPPRMLSPSSPPPKRQNFAFVPLLPVQDPPPVLPPPASDTSGPLRPKKTFNMTFLPVNAVPETQPLTPPHTTSEPLFDQSLGMAARTETSAPLPSSSASVSGSVPKSTDAHNQSPNRPQSPSSLSATTLTATRSMAQQPPPDMSPPALALSLPPSASSPAMESDTETDTTDTYVSDTDVESDAPSTSTLGSSLPSPPLEDDSDVDIEARLEQIKLGTSGAEETWYISREQDPGSYFPPVPVVLPESTSGSLPIPIPAHVEGADVPPALPSGPGQTPPLSVLYPSPTSQHQPLPALDALSTSISAPASSLPHVPLSHPQPPSAHDATTAAAELSAAVASRSLRWRLSQVPPSSRPPHFELEPSDTAAFEADLRDASATEVVQKLAALNLAVGADDTPVVSTASKLSGCAGVEGTPMGESPLLTLENMRVAWDAKARVGLGVEVEVCLLRSGQARWPRA